MGCDGGTIPKRDELVRTKKKPEQKDKTSELTFRWQHCALSQQALQHPVVACEMGRLFNKESIIEALLDKTGQFGTADVVSHIRNLRDVKELKLTENPSWTGAVNEKGDAYIDCQKAKWICPVVGQEMNGRFRFSFIWTCGCVISERAMKEMIKTKKQVSGSEAATHLCLRCQKPFDLSNVIALNPLEEAEIEALQLKMGIRRASKKSKKSSKTGESTSIPTATVTSGESLTLVQSADAEALTSTAALKRKAIDNLNKTSSQAEAVGTTDASSAGPSSSSRKKQRLTGSGDRIKGSYSVAKDPSVSENYKSLFTTHENAQSQQRAHWVTYNPFYN